MVHQLRLKPRKISIKMKMAVWQAHLGSTQVDTCDVVVTKFISCSLGEKIFKIKNVSSQLYDMVGPAIREVGIASICLNCYFDKRSDLHMVSHFGSVVHGDYLFSFFSQVN